MSRVAETMKDEAGGIAAAASGLAVYLTASDDIRGALHQRERAEAIYRRQGAQGLLPYTLANHADLLIRLGHETEAQSLLAEIEPGQPPASKPTKDARAAQRRSRHLRPPRSCSVRTPCGSWQSVRQTSGGRGLGRSADRRRGRVLQRAAAAPVDPPPAPRGGWG